MPEQAGHPRSGLRGRLPATGRALAAAVVLGGGCALGAVGPGTAQPAAAAPAAPPPTTAQPAAGQPAGNPAAGGQDGTTPPPGTHALCRITDPRLPELSGLVVVGDKMLATNDGGDRLTVYVLDSSCAVVDARTAQVDPYDPEDLAVGSDGTVWFSDTGDNRHERATVALLAMHPDGSTGIYRFTYPDGPHDAESLLLAPDGTPYIVTKELLGVSGVYRPSGPLTEGATAPLTKVGTVTFRATGTPGGPVGEVGQLLATGGAVSADGRLIALRTYTDAYVWPLSGSDVMGALRGTPVRIALPPAPQGEAISFGADSRELVVAGEGLPGDLTAVPAAAVAPAVATTVAPADAGRAAGVPPLTAGVIAAAVATLAVWIAGKIRRRRPPAG